MFQIDNVTPPVLGLAGLEANLSQEELLIQNDAHHFARDVMRPIAQQLDALPPEQVIAENSPIWDFFAQLQESGLMELPAISAMSNKQKSRLLPLILEELGWGDSGLTILALASSFPSLIATQSKSPKIIDRFANKMGCWIVTQPERGSDMVDLDNTETAVNCRQERGNLTATVEGDCIIIDGHSSSWVTGAPIAQCAVVNCAYDDGSGFWAPDGRVNYLSVLVPFDLAGVSTGQCLDKLGQRTMPQGEVIFDHVTVPAEFVIAKGEQAFRAFLGAMTFTNMDMGAIFTGVARAAFDHALEHVHQRKQGGTHIIHHQSVRLRIFELFQKVESCRAMHRRTFEYNYSESGPHILASITSKTWVTKVALEITQEVIQLFGGMGLSKEFPIEKLMRDAQAALIEDGENTILNLKGATWLSRWYQNNS